MKLLFVCVMHTHDVHCNFLLIVYFGVVIINTSLFVFFFLLLICILCDLSFFISFIRQYGYYI
jgi:hypothetical protein